MTNLTSVGMDNEETSTHPSQSTKRKNEAQDVTEAVKINESQESKTFVQDKPCVELVKTNLELTICLECESLGDQEETASNWNECRFVGWRRLKQQDTELIQVVGFLGPQDAREDDINLWSIQPTDSPTEDNSASEKILKNLHDSFKKLIDFELSMRNTYMKTESDFAQTFNRFLVT